LRNLFFLLSFLCVINLSQAQELKCQVQVVFLQVQGQGVDNRVFNTLQTSIFEFMNNRKWTNDNFTNIERIDCNILINLTKIISPGAYQGTIEVQSRRPVYKSSYTSVLLNYLDNNFSFSYVENQPLTYSENTYTDNLTAILAFYAYFILGLDYDTYSLKGGTPYFQKALGIVNNVPGDVEGEWTSGDRNRYWMINNLLDATYIPLRDGMYNYHRLGLDIMYDKKDEGLKTITASIENLQKIHAIKPASYSMQIFFNAKSDEVINIFSGAPPDIKTRIVPILNRIDPTNSNRYMKITGN
jgi:hypothetical protein